MLQCVAVRCSALRGADTDLREEAHNPIDSAYMYVCVCVCMYVCMYASMTRCDICDMFTCNMTCTYIFRVHIYIHM